MKTNYIILIAIGISLLSSCAKDGGYYDRKLETVVYNGTVYEYLKSKPGVFDSLIKVIDRIGDQSILDNEEITLFAPTNQSFQLAIQNLNNTRRIAEEPFEYLANVELVHLDTMTSQYIIRGKLPTDSMQKQDGIPLTSFKYGYPMHSKINYINSSGYVAGGPTVINFSDTKQSLFLRNWVTTPTISINIKTKNGIVHILNNEHVFGFNDFVRRFTYDAPPPNLFATVGGRGFVRSQDERPDNHVEHQKYVFDGNRETKYLLGGLPVIHWEFPEPQIANAYTLTSANDFPDRDPRDWTISGTNDLAGTWERLDVINGQLFEQRFQLKVFRFENAVPYKYYRIEIRGLRSGSTFQLADWSMNLEDR